MQTRHHRAFAALTRCTVCLFCMLTCATLLACTSSDDDDQDPFDPSGSYQGPRLARGHRWHGGGATGEEDSVTLASTQVTIGIACTLQLHEGSDVGVDDHNSGDDDVLRYFGKVQVIVPGQTCTLAGDGTQSLTLNVSDGLVTSWRGSPGASMELSLTGTTAGAGSVTYRFSGFR